MLLTRLIYHHSGMDRVVDTRECQQQPGQRPYLPSFWNGHGREESFCLGAPYAFLILKKSDVKDSSSRNLKCFSEYGVKYEDVWS